MSNKPATPFAIEGIYSDNEKIQIIGDYYFDRDTLNLSIGSYWKLAPIVGNETRYVPSVEEAAKLELLVANELFRLNEEKKGASNVSTYQDYEY